MANNELSGPIVASFIAKNILESKKPYYTYRIIIIPETIGSLTYLSRNLDKLKKRVVAGYVITCIGDSGHFSYLQSRQENTLVDRVTLHVLKYSTDKYNIYNYHDCRASDERQYCAPGIDLPVGSLTRTRPGKYPEYHTSLDDFNLVTLKGISGGYKVAKTAITLLLEKIIPKNNVLCEPQMGKRNLRPNISSKNKYTNLSGAAGTPSLLSKNLMNFLQYADGKNDLKNISKIIKTNYKTTFQLYKILIKHKLVS